MFYLYLLGVIVFIILLFYAIIKIRFRFWSIQPVFHFYNLWYWMFPPGIIVQDVPEKNKYTNLKDIKFINYTSLNAIDQDRFIKFIQDHYLNTTEVQYKPEKGNIVPYFENTKNSFFSMYFKESYDTDASSNIITSSNLVAVMTSRLLNVSINNNEFTTYYVDYLCVHKDHRKQGVAQQIILTHDYYQRNNTIVPTSFFKREGQLNAIVPLVVYRTYGFNMEYWNKSIDIHPQIKILRINKGNINLLSTFIKQHKNLFSVYVCPDINILIDLIESGNILIYCLMQNSNVLSIYFFRDSSTFYNERRALDCFASINNCLDDTVFIAGLSKITKTLKEHYKFLIIENISHNYKIIENIIKEHTPYFVSPTAYYFYNFATRPVLEKNVLIIC